MKKTTALFLSLLMVVLSCSCLMITPAVATDSTEDAVTAYFENINNWIGNKCENVSGVGSCLTVGLNNYSNVKASSVTTPVHTEGNAGSIKITGTSYHAASIKMPSDLSANTDYTFSFWYLADALHSSGYYFTKIGLFAPNATANSNYLCISNGSADGWLDCITASTSFTTTDGDYDGATKVSDSSRNTKTEANTWKQLTFTFNSKDYSEIYLIFKVDFTASNLYLDDFSLTGDYFATPSNWNRRSYSSNFSLDATDPAWSSATQSTTVVKNSNESIAINVNYNAAFIKLPSYLKQNQQYTMSFWYQTPTTFGGNDVFERIGIFSPTAAGSNTIAFGNTQDGFLVHKTNNTTGANYYSIDGKLENAKTISENACITSPAVDTWYQISFDFFTGDYDDLVLCFKIGEAVTVYLDDFVLTEKDYYEYANNWGMDAWKSYSTLSQGSYPGFNPNTNTNFTITQNTATDYVNNSDASVQLKATSQYPYIYLPSYKENTDYILSFDYYTDQDQSITDQSVFEWLGVFATVDGCSYAWDTTGFVSCIGTSGWYTNTNHFTQKTTSTSMSTKILEKGWHSISIPFNTEDYADLALVLVMKGTSCFYMDNISITEVYPVAVENGSADVTAATEGTVVTVTPDAAPAGMVFDHWEDVFENASIWSLDENNVAKFNMPAASVSLKAVYAYTIESDTTVSEVIQAKGNSIRKQSGDLPQGLRFKYFMDKDYETLYDGYTVSKVGLLVLPTAYLGDSALKVGETYTYNEKNYQPIDKEVLAENIQTDVNDAENIYFTAALTNIGLQTDGTTIDYNAYATDFTVRTYTIYEHADGTTFTVYGASLSANVFGVVKSIIDAPLSDEDLAAANAAIADCKAEYEAWVAANTTPVE